MRISKSAPDLLKKAATSVKSKTGALRTKLVFVASLRRRLAMVYAMSRQMHGRISSDGREKQARVEHGSKAVTIHKAMTTRKEQPGDHGGRAHLAAGMFEVAMFEEDYYCYPDWTRSLFDDDNCYNDEEEDGHDNDYDELDVFDDEPSVVQIIRSNREAQCHDFNMDDNDIDEACDMFIRKCRSQMNLSLE